MQHRIYNQDCLKVLLPTECVGGGGGEFNPLMWLKVAAKADLGMHLDKCSQYVDPFPSSLTPLINGI